MYSYKKNATLLAGQVDSINQVKTGEIDSFIKTLFK
jgi:hypothetical protein